MTITNDPNAIYCMKCKTKTETTNVEQITLNNGRPAATAYAPSAARRNSVWGRGSLEVGTTYVTVAKTELGWEGLFRVGTGAIECVVPGQDQEANDLIPEGERRCTVADRNEIGMDIAASRE